MGGRTGSPPAAPVEDPTGAASRRSCREVKGQHVWVLTTPPTFWKGSRDHFSALSFSPAVSPALFQDLRQDMASIFAEATRKAASARFKQPQLDAEGQEIEVSDGGVSHYPSLSSVDE